MLKLFSILAVNAFSVAEFEFCYNYIFYEPFQEKVIIDLTEPLQFENIATRNQKSENVIFRQANQSIVQLRINGEINVNQQDFSLFFYVFQQCKIFDSQIKIQLVNTGSSNVSLLVQTETEFPIYIYQSLLNISSMDSINNFSGVAKSFQQPITINQSVIIYNLKQVTCFYGISAQTDVIKVQNTSFAFQVSATTSYGLLQLVTGNSLFYNLVISGSLSGSSAYGLIFENRASANFSSIDFSLKLSVTSQACGFVYKSSGSVHTFSINFVNYSSSISIPSIYPSTFCPCIPSASLINGLCICPKGTLASNDECSCNIENAFLEAGECKCPMNATLTNGKCQCPAGSILFNRVCVCQTENAFVVGGACVCGINAVNESNKCVCPAQSVLSNGECVCTTKNAVVVGNKCQCAVNAQNVSGICVCPAKSSQINGECLCAVSNQFIQNNTCVCAMYATLQGDQCVCPQFSVETNKICSCTVKYMSMINSTCQCNQLTGSTLINGVCTCPYRATINGNVCQCPAGASFKEDKCICTSGYTWGYINDGNYWCKNLNLCCSHCWGKIGAQYGCSDNEYHSSCTQSGTTVAP
ncbi:Conserved_hypothetical protein [Hexamita inflata]|uniref:Transmembrane protein n=1 Tax=Hexamita inflata TaxID=28002 RepID=A0ABP1M3D9_9EUKA